jgi:cold shock protein
MFAAKKERRCGLLSRNNHCGLAERLGIAHRTNYPVVVRFYQENSMATGTVKWFNPTKGYGFIQPQAGGKDVFVHISAVERAGLMTLNEGQSIQYEIESSRGKESAINLKVK